MSLSRPSHKGPLGRLSRGTLPWGTELSPCEKHTERPPAGASVDRLRPSGGEDSAGTSHSHSALSELLGQSESIEKNSCFKSLTVGTFVT